MLAKGEDRLIITRNLKYRNDKSFRLIISNNYIQQLSELKDLFQNEMVNPGTRCILCNNLTVEVSKEKIKDLLPEYIFNNHNSFKICLRCGKILWQGTHYDNMYKILEKILE